MLDEETLKEIAAQLRKPAGEFGKEVGNKMNESNLFMNQQTIAELDISAEDLVFEIGMGNGFFVQEILAKDTSVTYIGCDYSEEMIRQATNNNQRFIDEKRASFHLTSAHTLPAENNSADKLFTVNTLYFWENKTAVLSEFKRVLKKKGMLIIAIRPDTCIKQYPSSKYNFEYFSQSQVEVMLLQHGFSVLSAKTFKEPEVEIMDKKVTPEFCIIKATV